ncbi:lipoyl synthase [Prevotella melaninogenica]|uniref:lipoyl synthase n=1 Tax=Prevotella melaninogenica TaxID=28132 RepID=UPI001C5DC95A|nr:lipoyl synthase [Prevotella melaninogenica]MBW4735005.1 lipoyl synthase [Prevotella melaninogenica]MBW4737413.1 lipoyl synthase [Prevotella melaninogenica]MBW4880052.1 lipoyl synthase [Prevotella melaninogenica]
MKYILLPKPDTIHQLPFYFAVEEYVARHYTDDDYFMGWRVNPTVMLGRNQLIDNEVNTDYCKEHKIDIFRRKSGGGCIYADKGCIQFSYISRSVNANEAFAQYMQRMADLLKGLKIDAQLSGRNDILINGTKVSGCAFYQLSNRSVLHNSLLFDTQLDHLSNALTPAKEKLQSKGVASVRQRVTNVATYTQLDILAFMDYVRQEMCGTEVLELTEEDMKGVAEIEKELSSDNFVYGKNPKYSLVRKHRFEGVGTLEAHIELKNNIIGSINMVGDYFLLGDIDHDFLSLLKGCEFTREAVEERLKDIDLSTIIRGLKLRQFLRLLFGREPHVMKPKWLKIDLTSKKSTGETAGILAKHHMNTICTSGLCPNRSECWMARTATLMIGGDICTRKCRFCNTLSGRPRLLNPDEPRRVAESVKALKLRYAVITSVDRDDLPDYGAAHWIKTIEEIRRLNPDTKIELLIPDFMGKADLIRQVMATHPHVAGHNMETVRRLTPSVRSVARYERSLEVLREIANCGITAKTGFMLGLGETHDEILETMDDILSTGCQRLTLGQYLQPTAEHLPVKAYITPEKFAEYKQIALDKGFKHVVSGPLVRSSYHAAEGV